MYIIHIYMALFLLLHTIMAQNHNAVYITAVKATTFQDACNSFFHFINGNSNTSPVYLI